MSRSGQHLDVHILADGLLPGDAAECRNSKARLLVRGPGASILGASVISQWIPMESLTGKMMMNSLKLDDFPIYQCIYHLVMTNIAMERSTHF